MPTVWKLIGPKSRSGAGGENGSGNGRGPPGLKTMGCVSVSSPFLPPLFWYMPTPHNSSSRSPCGLYQPRFSAGATSRSSSRSAR